MYAIIVFLLFLKQSIQSPALPKSQYHFYYSRDIVNKTKDGKFYLPFTLFEYDKQKGTLRLKKYIDSDTEINSDYFLYYIPVNGGMMETILTDVGLPNESHQDK